MPVVSAGAFSVPRVAFTSRLFPADVVPICTGFVKNVCCPAHVFALARLSPSVVLVRVSVEFVAPVTNVELSTLPSALRNCEEVPPVLINPFDSIVVVVTAHTSVTCWRVGIQGSIPSRLISQLE